MSQAHSGISAARTVVFHVAENGFGPELVSWCEVLIVISEILLPCFVVLFSMHYYSIMASRVFDRKYRTRFQNEVIVYLMAGSFSDENGAISTQGDMRCFFRTSPFSKILRFLGVTGTFRHICSKMESFQWFLKMACVTSFSLVVKFLSCWVMIYILV